ncbi:MAG: hypothetical protein AAF755_08055 [Pseudomonadota bacterium]
MSTGWSHWCAAVIGMAVGVGFALTVRLPLPFSGFSAVVAGGFAGLATLTCIAWMPPRWIWSDTELLRHAFKARHGLSDTAAKLALHTITTAHARAHQLRQASSVMREDIAKMVSLIAERLDASAREIFYEPERHRALRAVLIRSELIEDAARAHAALRRRGHQETEDVSRKKLVAAMEALQAAFDETDLLAARGLLRDVAVASNVAENLLAPRGRLDQTDRTTPSS